MPARDVTLADNKIGDYDDWVKVCDWVAANTPSDALFLTPRLNLSFKWRAGCPNLSDDTGCQDGTNAAGLTGIGQTWSTPQVAFIKGFSTTVPVVIIGGGYDSCEDNDSTTVTCTSSSKGNKIFILRADTGALQRASELTARLTLSSPVLNPEEDGQQEKVQFERIVAGLAKQLRSTLDRKLGRYSVDLPVFPQA